MNPSGFHIPLTVKKWKYAQQDCHPIFIYDHGVPRLSKTFDAYNFSQLWQKTKCFFLIFHKLFNDLYLPSFVNHRKIFFFNQYHQVSYSHTDDSRVRLLQDEEERVGVEVGAIPSYVGQVSNSQIHFHSELIWFRINYVIKWFWLLTQLLKKKILMHKSSNPWGGLFVLFDFFHEAGYIN
jgi:hypothetical protein